MWEIKYLFLTTEVSYEWEYNCITEQMESETHDTWVESQRHLGQAEGCGTEIQESHEGEEYHLKREMMKSTPWSMPTLDLNFLKERQKINNISLVWMKM